MGPQFARHATKFGEFLWSSGDQGGTQFRILIAEFESQPFAHNGKRRFATLCFPRLDLSLVLGLGQSRAFAGMRDHVFGISILRSQLFCCKRRFCVINGVREYMTVGNIHVILVVLFVALPLFTVFVDKEKRRMCSARTLVFCCIGDIGEEIR